MAPVRGIGAAVRGQQLRESETGGLTAIFALTKYALFLPTI